MRLIIWMIFLLGAIVFSAVRAYASPNIIVIMTDDQTLEDLWVMEKTVTLIGAEGTIFDNSFVSFPLCCPSRATFLTGQYSHNHGIEGNVPPAGGYEKLDHSNTLPVWLQEAGYYTIHIGKYLNWYGTRDPREILPGWSNWQGLVDTSTYKMYEYTINDNGILVAYGKADEDYQTDVLADRAVAVINERAGETQPFFLWITPMAVHGEFAAGLEYPRPAPRHKDFFANEPLPIPPSFNEADVSDKPAFIRNLPPLTEEAQQRITTRYRNRLGSLLAVDDLVERVITALETTNQLANTVIFFTSDNGYFHGEHRIPFDKFWAYDESVRVPLLVRGGGFPAGRVVKQLVANIDLAPTIVELAGATARRIMDGQSLLQLALNPELEKNRPILLEVGPNIQPRYEAVRTEGYLYVEYRTGERELYDMQIDPFQLESLHDDPNYDDIKAQLQTELNQLRTCAGANCNLSTPTPTPTPEPNGGGGGGGGCSIAGGGVRTRQATANALVLLFSALAIGLRVLKRI